MRLLGLAVVVGLMALGACSGASSDPNVAACDSEANDDPLVHDLMIGSAGSPSFMLDHKEELAQARKRATLVCLRRKGLAPPGGVQMHDPGS